MRGDFDAQRTADEARRVESKSAAQAPARWAHGPGRSFPPASLSARQLDAGIEALICQWRGAHPRWGPQAVVRAGQGEGEPAAVALDYLPGAGPPWPGASVQAQAPPPGLQALAAPGADAAVAAGCHRVGVLGRRHGTEADLRPG